VQVKRAAADGPFEAKFTPHAQGSFCALLVDADVPSVRIGANVIRIGGLRSG
jgi:hypothetical protein